MKTRIVLIVMLAVIGLSNSLTAQSPNWAWARSASDTNAEEGWSVATDASGNVFMTGFFIDSTITFDTTTLTNAGQNDIFVVKYDASGNALWAKSAGGTSDDVGKSVAIDANGNVLVTGFFSSPTITFGTFTLTNVGIGDIFIVKYDASGTVLWAKSVGGTDYEVGNCIATDASGNVLITGYFYSPTITFGTFTLTNGGNAGDCDIFIVKYDSSGTVLWAKSAGGTSNDYGYSVATDASGNVLVTGYFYSPTITFGTFTLTNTGSADIFIVKYDASGTVLWAKSAGGTDEDEGYGIATDASGNVLATGYFTSPTITFGSFTLTNPINIGIAPDIFIVKYDSSGTVLWAKSAGGSGGSEGYSVATDASGNVLVAGSFYSPFITFDSDTLFPSSSATDPMFLVKYNPTGTVLWAKGLASGGDDQNGVATDAFGNIFVGGDFAMEPFIVGTDTLHQTGDENAFIAKINASAEGIEKITIPSGIFIYPNPNDGKFTISYRLSSPHSELLIADVFGRTLSSYPLNSPAGTQNINLSSLSNGIYYWHLVSSQSTSKAGYFILSK